MEIFNKDTKVLDSNYIDKWYRYNVWWNGYKCGTTWYNYKKYNGNETPFTITSKYKLKKIKRSHKGCYIELTPTHVLDIYSYAISRQMYANSIYDKHRLSHTLYINDGSAVDFYSAKSRTYVYPKIKSMSFYHQNKLCYKVGIAEKIIEINLYKRISDEVPIAYSFIQLAYPTDCRRLEGLKQSIADRSERIEYMNIKCFENFLISIEQ